MVESLRQDIKDYQGTTNKLVRIIDYESDVSDERTIPLQSTHISFTYQSLIKIACYVSLLLSSLGLARFTSTYSRDVKRLEIKDTFS